MEAAGILGALQSRVAFLPGSSDREGRPLLLVQVPTETQPWVRDQLDVVLKYLISILSQETRCGGVCVLVDAQRSAWRLARTCIRQVTQSLGADVAAHLVIRPEAFWDKQRVDNCTRTPKEGEPVYIPMSRLHKYVESSQLPEDLGGSWPYNHNQWIQNRIYVEAFTKGAEEAFADLEKLEGCFSNGKSGVRASGAEETLSLNQDAFNAAKELVRKVLQAGKEVLEQLDTGLSDMPRQDTKDSRQQLESLLDNIQSKWEAVNTAWSEMEKNSLNSRELYNLETGVARVTNWILGPAENMLNGQQEVGFDVASAEKLRQEHEKLELQCRETYGHYAELLHKIDTLPEYEIDLPEDLKSQRDFMDFVCRSFATRLERRRNVLITSLRFFRLVAEYFETTSNVFETLVKYNHVDDYESATSALRDLQESHVNIEILGQAVLREGEKLADILSMPVKDALGRDVAVNYESDIMNVHDLLDAIRSRKSIFYDSMELQKLTLEQISHIHSYEKDAGQAVQWLDDLFLVMLKEHMHVGCSVPEIQQQKDEHQSFQETAKGTYEYGCQLLSAALALRQSCRLPTEVNTLLTQKLWQSWKRLQNIGQEQMTRLRVSAVFHRSVEEHCNQLQELMEAVKAMCQGDDLSKRRSRMHKFLTTRERLLLEVGRMVRLGRLLRTRLREPLCSEQESEDGSHNNLTAVEAISDKLVEVTALAEQLDASLCGAQQDGSPSGAVGPNIKRILDGTASSAPEEWYSNLKGKPRNTAAPEESSKSEDEFVTASECTCTPPSRSSSFHTASECGGASPWWEVDPQSEGEATESEPKMVAEPQKALVRKVTEMTEVVVHEVTETTSLKMSYSPTLDITSYQMTSEVVREGGGDKAADVERGDSDKAEQDLPDEELANQLREVRQEDQSASYYYHQHIARHAIKSIL